MRISRGKFPEIPKSIEIFIMQTIQPIGREIEWNWKLPEVNFQPWYLDMAREFVLFVEILASKGSQPKQALQEMVRNSDRNICFVP